ncbi:MAG: pentapeptide repeat-containing protein [Roseibium album]|uniref:pentapeptide repeat-containing protein n=1 Tax=Roseibium album TaxID=311410 RepID=UPI0032EE18B1
MTTIATEDNANHNVVQYENKEFSNSKLEGGNSLKFGHFVLRKINGKKQKYSNCDFSYSDFINSYFHDAEFTNCKFIGTKFNQCNFRNAQFKACDFRYAEFHETSISTSQILNNRPQEPNIQRDLFRVLRRNSESIGDVKSARIFSLAEVDARKEHLRKAIKKTEHYYREKYSGKLVSLKLRVENIFLWLDGFLWGHGERLWKMIIPITILLFACALILTFENSNSENTIESTLSFFKGAFFYYFDVFLDVENSFPAPKIPFLERIVVVARYLSFGVLIAGLFRWLSHR